MQEITRRTKWAAIAAAALTLAVTVTTAGAQADVPGRINTDRRGLAAHGYDVVAYITQGQALMGEPAFQASWRNATFRFANADHRDRFLANPEQYAPQYGGFCAYAVSRGYTADVDPEAWSVVGGRLFLNYSKSVRQTWLADRDENIAKGDRNWTTLSRQR
jgi:hypothetical protein